MATLQMRSYGNLGGNGSQGAAADAATWAAAIADARAGDTIHVAAVTGQNILKPPSTYAQLRKSGVDMAFDGGIELWPQAVAADWLGVGGIDNAVWGLGNVSGPANSGPFDKNGRWGIQLNRRKNTQARGGWVLARFNSCSGLWFEDMWVESMCETLASGQVTDYGASAPCFAYTAGNIGEVPTDIRMIRVTAHNCTYGYGLMQAAAGKNLYFTDCAQEGGSLMRAEQDTSPASYRGIDGLFASGIWNKNGNCAFQANPHTNKPNALGMQNYQITDMTCESMSRAYLLNTDGGLNQGFIDGLAVEAGPNAQIAVPTLPGGGDSNSTTDGRTSQAWKRGPTKWLADVSRGVIENADNQVRNVWYAGNFPGGGVGTGADWHDMGSAAALEASAHWGAGFDTGPPPTSFAGTGGATPGSTLTKSKVTPVTHPFSASGGISTAGLDVLTKIFGETPHTPEWLLTPADPSENPSAFLQAHTDQVVDWFWTYDGQVYTGAAASAVDQLSVPTPLGLHEISVVVRDSDGRTSDPLGYSWTRVQGPPPPPPTEPPLTPPPITGLLGCGYHTAYLRPRGGASRLGTIPHTSISYTNPESDTGQATITIQGVSRWGDDCCHLLGVIREWMHEVELRRSGPVAFIGPITAVRTQGDTATITASDMSAWFAKRRVHLPHSFKQADLCSIAKVILDDAISSDRSPGISVVIDAPSGTTIDYAVPVGDVQLASEVLRALVGFGLVWRMRGRVVHLGLPSQAVMPVLTDEAFVDAPPVLTTGTEDTNDVVVQANNQGDTVLIPGSAQSMPDKLVRGSLESVTSAPDLATTADANDIATQGVEDGTNSQRVVDAGPLSPDAPALFSDLEPLLRVRLVVGGCRPISSTYRVAKRTVTEQEAGDVITVSWEPL